MDLLRGQNEQVDSVSVSRIKPRLKRSATRAGAKKCIFLSATLEPTAVRNWTSFLLNPAARIFCFQSRSECARVDALTAHSLEKARWHT